MANAEFYGDSIMDHEGTPATYGGGVWCDSLCGVKGWTRVGAGTAGGDTTRGAIIGASLQNIPANIVPQHGVDGVTTRIVPYSPDVLIIGLGTNDYFYATANFNPTTFAAAWDTLWAAINAMAHIPAITAMVNLIALPAIGPAQHMFGSVPAWASSEQDAVDQLNAVISQKAAQYGATLIDVSGCPKAFLQPDGLHPTTSQANLFYLQQSLQALSTNPFGGAPDRYWPCGGHVNP